MLAVKQKGIYVRALHWFRRVTGITEVQIFIPVLYQLYLLCCLGLGFNIKKELLYLLGIFAFFDALEVLAIKLLAARKPMTVCGKMLCAVNLLLTSGIAGQVVFSHRFYGNASGVVSAEYSVSRLAIFLVVGCVAGVVCALLTSVAKKTALAGAKSDKNNPMLCYVLTFLFVGACAVFYILLKTRGNNTDSSDQWIGGFQPGEFLKFAFLFLLAFVSGFPNEQKGWFVLRTAMQFGSLGVMLLYYALLGEFGSIVVVMLCFVLFLIVSNRNWIYTTILIAAALVICIPITGVMISKGNEYIEAKYTLTMAEKEDLLAREEAGLLEDGEEPWREPESTFFTRQYEKIYWRVMNVVDIHGTDPDRLPGVREYIQTASNYQPAAALKAIGISEFVPVQAPVFHYVAVGDADYIYTSVLQCGGLVSVIVLLFAYLLLADSAFSLISSNCDMINRYLVFTMITSVLLQMIINILGVNNLIPLTGITLPLVSRGGSSVTVTLMMVAVVLFADADYMGKKQRLADAWNLAENEEKGVRVHEEESFRIG
ncbi:MAG: hypothetical protein E7523_04625 [Ruminococcaceae bacterium]|nr:hypothetical protein [Oscillospiraceae bacterium]